MGGTPVPPRSRQPPPRASTARPFGGSAIPCPQSPPAGVGGTSGAGVVVGALFGIASTAAPEGAEVELAVVSVFDIAKVSAQAWTQGVKVYWDGTAKNCTHHGFGQHAHRHRLSAGRDPLCDGPGPAQRLWRVMQPRPTTTPRPRSGDISRHWPGTG
ncbi:DUF2190 family protein [Xanthobacter sp. 126]|uniref:DUF2190 family protein n=1 Tax=Xanthobacter sp. 126 TaxID=1131814 RepID=UPI001FDA3A5B|nr:DUF2190 family protein [Xanthobacter sp. 126]